MSPDTCSDEGREGELALLFEMLMYGLISLYFNSLNFEFINLGVL